MENNETFILVVIQDHEGHTFNFTKSVKDHWTRPVSAYQQEGLEMVADWLEVGYEIKAFVLVDRNPLFHITRIL